MNGIQEVSGSIPLISTNEKEDLKRSSFCFAVYSDLFLVMNCYIMTMIRKESVDMSIFKKKKIEPENNDGIFLLEQHDKGLLDDTSFLKVFGKAKVFYSTPYGDHKDGNGRLFALPASENTGYLPVFSSHERIKEFYENAGRTAYMIMEGSFLSFLETTSKINKKAPVKMGAVIDPGYFGVTVDADMLDTAINMIR